MDSGNKNGITKTSNYDGLYFEEMTANALRGENITSYLGRLVVQDNQVAVAYIET